MNNLSKVLRHLFSPIWPVNCPICNNPLLPHEEVLCLGCLAKIPRINIDRTHTFLGAPENSVKQYSWFVYNTEHPAHLLIHDIKYNDRRKLARKLGREFAMQKLMDNKSFDLIIPIPIHWTKLLKRSYNQTHEIALGVSDILKVPVSKALYAKREHDTQTRKSTKQRIKNVEGIFALRDPEKLNGMNIAILDDVITTGATMFSALQAILEKSSPASVSFLSLAQTGSF